MDLSSAAEQLFASAEAGDWDAFRAAFADDAVLYRNVGGVQSIDEAMKTLPLLTAVGTTLRYENARRFVGDRAVTEVHDVVFTKPGGEVARLDVCVVIQFGDDGLIARADEYLDSAQAKALT